MSVQAEAQSETTERSQIKVDIVGVGFGPAMGGFLTTLSRLILNEDGTPHLESRVSPGLPLQVICYERAEGFGFGVSGAVTRARGIRASFPDKNLDEIPLSAKVSSEKLVYLLDPIGSSRRSLTLRLADRVIRALPRVARLRNSAVEMPFTPRVMRKHDGLVLSLGQFNQWVSEQVSSSGAVQLWPASPVSEPLIDKDAVVGIRLADQGVDLRGIPAEGFMLGMDVHADLTVVADGPVGAVGRKLDSRFGLPNGNHANDWALGMKFVLELREDSGLAPGTVLHTFGFPEPEIFGFLYAHPDRLASVGIFIPSSLRTPVRTAYRYLQHYVQHPYLWRCLRGASLKSWGAKSLQESGRHGEPFLAGNGYARIGEGSGSTNVLAGSGVDEAWTTGVQLAEAVAELLESKRPFTRENLEATYVRRRRASWLERESLVAADSRNGFHKGVVRGLVGMAIAAATRGSVYFPNPNRPLTQPADTLEKVYRKRISPDELKRLQEECGSQGAALHDKILDRCGWPGIRHDGQLFVSQQDALLMGGSVQAPPGYADHVVFLKPELCRECEPKLCVAMCSGQAITLGDLGVPAFDREKCVYCGACLWNCRATNGSGKGNIEFRAGAGGLHSSLN